MSGHTPGPWHVGQVGKPHCETITTRSLAVFASDKQEDAKGNIGVVCVVAPPEFTTEIDESNARLIAAAPDQNAFCHLAEAEIDELFIVIDEWEGVSDVIDHIGTVLARLHSAARAAIAKAEGTDETSM